jgi:hypothetical protein
MFAISEVTPAIKLVLEGIDSLNQPKLQHEKVRGNEHDARKVGQVIEEARSEGEAGSRTRCERGEFSK